MVVGKTMIVAGIGCRKGVSVAEVIAAVETALDTHGLAMGALSALATTAFKREEEAIFAAGRELGLPVVVVEDEVLASMTPINESPLRQSLLPESAAPPLTCLPAPAPRVLRQAQDGEGRLHQGFRQSSALQDHRGSQSQTSSPSAIAGDSSETLTTPSPLRGGRQGGGQQHSNRRRGGNLLRRPASALLPPPSIPPLKGEGGIDVASYDLCDGHAPSRRNEGVGTLTHSELSLALAGVPSVSEAAALAAAGAGARLYGPRIVVGPVTCALATSGDAA
jgi:cobalt-precorrin 5A hydrolase